MSTVGASIAKPESTIFTTIGKYFGVLVEEPIEVKEVESPVLVSIESVVKQADDVKQLDKETYLEEFGLTIKPKRKNRQVEVEAAVKQAEVETFNIEKEIEKVLQP